MRPVGLENEAKLVFSKSTHLDWNFGKQVAIKNDYNSSMRQNQIEGLRRSKYLHHVVLKNEKRENRSYFPPKLVP